MDFDERFLVREAMMARESSYSPYSGFRVGAALLTESGTVYRGCNIENAAFSPTNCAERTAFFKAVSEGERKFRAIAVAADPRDYVYPCGVCRQVMAEFCSLMDFVVICVKSENEYRKYLLKDLLPGAFTKADLQKNGENKSINFI